MTLPLPQSAPKSGARLVDIRAHPPTAEARALLSECYEVFEARLREVAQSTLELAGDLFENDDNVVPKDVTDFLNRRPEWLAQFPVTLKGLFERRVSGTLRRGRRPDADISLSSLKVLTAYDHEKQAALAAATAFLGGFTRRERAALDLRIDELLIVEPPGATDNPFGIPYIVDALGVTSRAVYPNPRVWRPLLERLLIDVRTGINKLYMSINRHLADRGVLPEIQAALRARSTLRPRDDRDLFGTFAHMLGQSQPGLGIDVAVPEIAPGVVTKPPLEFADFAAKSPATDVPAPRLRDAGEAGGARQSLMDDDTIMTGLAALAEAAARLEDMAPGGGKEDVGENEGLPQVESLMALGSSTPLFATLAHWQKLDLATALTEEVGRANEGDARGVVVPYNLIPHIRAAIAGHIKTPEDGITMDVIALLFDYVFRDESISDSARELFARLQVPIVKAALIDRKFFHDRHHPTRVFLDRLADAAIGTTHHDEYRANFVVMAQAVIDDVCTHFDVDVEIFRVAGVRIAAFSEQERRKSESTAVERIASVNAAEEGEADRAQVIAEIRDRLAGLDLPFEIRSFVDTIWASHLTDLRRREGAEGDAAKAAFATLDDLLWSIAVKERANQKKRLTKMVPGLIGELRKGCIAQAVPAERTKTFLDSVYELHMAAIKPADPSEAAPSVVPAAPILNVYDYVNEMVVGTWLTFLGDAEPMDARLTYISPKRTKYVFTGRYFSGAQTFTPEELAYQLGSGRARVLVEPVPLWDRAVSAALDALAAKNPPAARVKQDPTHLPA